MIARGYIIAAALAAAAVGGWTAQGWRLGAKADRVAAAQSAAVAAANASALAVQKKLDSERDAHAERLSEIDKDYTKKLKEANAETNRLATCVDNGTCGLRVNVVRTACPSEVPGTGAAGSVDSGAGSALTPEAQRAYFSLRAGIVSAETKLAACQSTLSENVKPAQR